MVDAWRMGFVIGKIDFGSDLLFCFLTFDFGIYEKSFVVLIMFDSTKIGRS